MNCAVIDPKTGEIINMIVADPEKDAPPRGYILKVIDEGEAVDQRSRYVDGKFERTKADEPKEPDKTDVAIEGEEK